MKQTKSSEFDAHETKSGVVALKDGPFRKYIPADIYSKSENSELTKQDVFRAVLIFLASSLFSWGLLDIGPQIDLQPYEELIYKNIQRYQRGEFFLFQAPPFGFQLLSHFADDLVLLKGIMIMFGAATLSLTYLTMRRKAINSYVSLLLTAMIGSIPIFGQESIRISLDVMNWFFFVLTLYSWETLKLQDIRACKKKLSSSIRLGIVLGLGMSTKYIGFMMWIWAILVSSLQLWRIIGDISLSSFQIIGITIRKFVFIFVLPLSVFVTSQYYLLTNWVNDNKDDSAFMPTHFQAYLRGPEMIPKNLHYGSTVVLRHSASLAGYLASYNATYFTGSFGQLVTASDNEDSEWNHWIIEPVNKQTAKGKLLNPKLVRFRHKLTGKLLSVSSSKPPVSEQEYDKEVSCIGNFTYKGNDAEFWRLEVVGGRDFHPSISKVKLFNMGQSCHLLSHDLRLPEGLGYTEQEVVCLDPATFSSALWEIRVIESNEETPQLVSYGVDRNLVKPSNHEFWQLLGELLISQIRFNALIYKDFYGSMVMSWPLYDPGQPVIRGIWLSSIVSIVLVALWFVVDTVRANPWAIFDERGGSVASQQCNVESIRFVESGIELTLAWCLNYFIYTKLPPQDLRVTLYMPSFICGEMLLGHLLNIICNKREKSAAED